jgi:hypothetical protein
MYSSLCFFRVPECLCKGLDLVRLDLFLACGLGVSTFVDLILDWIGRASGGVCMVVQVIRP